MAKGFRKLCSEVYGSVAIDWIVLIAALIAMAIAAWVDIDASADGLMTPAHPPATQQGS